MDTVSYPIPVTQSGCYAFGSNKVNGIIVNSHTNGTIQFLDGKKASLNTYASGTLTSDATNVSDGETLTIGSITYRFKDTPAQAYDIKIGADAATTLDYVKAAVNATGTDGTEYYAGTLAHPDVIATTNTNTTQLIVARSPIKSLGEAIATTETSAHLSWGGATLAGGVNGSVKIGGTYTFATGSQVITFEKPIVFGTGIFAVVGGTLDATLLVSPN